ncbi:GNAT family N-acetyltransferase [Hymenobacter sp. BT635]|uniref:GNAT family N-acetyltransferase n=1 Tax=Hymenobacter nitidus TaxID=2880929 RepID=A0ABS8AB96_9BACT|nr:GNAT family protein [Hymenobacter nitidus]MCB2376669.1 GNAT family N-acetyltransferase [Hymenobacter nitidus]
MPFTLRAWQPDDLPSLLRYANNPEIARFMTDQFPYPFTEEKGRGFLSMATSHSPQRIFAIDVDGQAAGGIGLHPQTDVQCKNAELGYWLAQPFWGRGIVTEAIRQTVDYGFRTFDITRIFARPYGTNIGSQRALEKAGFVLEGRFEQTLFKNGEFLDELIYAVRRRG